MIELRPYQHRAVEALLQQSRGILRAPAGSGKSLVGAAFIDRWLTGYKRLNGSLPIVRWLANTQEQLTQASEAIANFPAIAQRCVIKINCYAAVPNCADAVLVVCDEAHHIASPEYRKCLDGCTGWRIGLSATPHRADDFAADVYILIGPIVCTIERAELIATGKLAQAVVRFHAPNVPHEFESQIAAIAEPLIRNRLRFWRKFTPDEIRRMTLWQVCLDIGIFKNSRRNAKIIELGRAHAADSTLILVGSIEHGELLAKDLPGSVVAHSKMGTKKRREAMTAFRAGSLRCMIGTTLLDEGFDAPRASALIVTAGGRSSRRAEQTSGRVLRPFADKEFGVIEDFYDHGHYMTRAQSTARRKVYEGLGYEIDDQQSLRYSRTAIDSEPPSAHKAEGPVSRKTGPY